MNQFVNPEACKQILAKVLGCCRIGAAAAKAFIRKRFGVQSGMAKDLSEKQLAMLLAWTHGQVLDLVQTIVQRNDAGGPPAVNQARP